MKFWAVLMLSFASALASTLACADVNQGDHVLLPIQNYGLYTLGKVKEIDQRGLVTAVEMSSARLPESLVEERTHRFLDSQVIEEVRSVRWNKTGEWIKQGDTANILLGHGSKKLRVLFAFANGYAAFVDEETYWEWVKANQNEDDQAINDDHLFTLKPVFVYIR